MFKKNIFFALVILSCHNIHGIVDGQESLTTASEQKENQTSLLSQTYAKLSQADAKHTIIGVGVSTVACAIAMYIAKDKEDHDKCVTIGTVLTLATLGTMGCVMTDTMIFAKERDKTAMNFHEQQQKKAMAFALQRLELQKELAQTSQSK